MMYLIIIVYILIGMIVVGFEQYSDIKNNSLYARPSERNMSYTVILLLWPGVAIFHIISILEFIVGLLLLLISLPFWVLNKISEFIVTKIYNLRHK